VNGPLRVRKRPITVDTLQYTGHNTDAVVAWVGECAYRDELGALIIRTPEGDHIASPGDWVIRGIEGEHYPCRASIFDATYEPVF